MSHEPRTVEADLAGLHCAICRVAFVAGEQWAAMAGEVAGPVHVACARPKVVGGPAGLSPEARGKCGEVAMWLVEQLTEARRLALAANAVIEYAPEDLAALATAIRALDLAARGCP